MVLLGPPTLYTMSFFGSFISESLSVKWSLFLLLKKSKKKRSTTFKPKEPENEHKNSFKFLLIGTKTFNNCVSSNLFSKCLSCSLLSHWALFVDLVSTKFMDNQTSIALGKNTLDMAIGIASKVHSSLIVFSIFKSKKGPKNWFSILAAYSWNTCIQTQLSLWAINFLYWGRNN